MNIKEIRQRRNITQVELAANLGIGQPAIASWETGVSKPRTDMLPKLAAILGCTIDELFGGEEVS